MSALANKQAHIPFRNSKLTQLLQDSLCGQAKAMMFVHIAPEVSSQLALLYRPAHDPPQGNTTWKYEQLCSVLF